MIPLASLLKVRPSSLSKQPKIVGRLSKPSQSFSTFKKSEWQTMKSFSSKKVENFSVSIQKSFQKNLQTRKYATKGNGLAGFGAIDNQYRYFDFEEYGNQSDREFAVHFKGNTVKLAKTLRGKNELLDFLIMRAADETPDMVKRSEMVTNFLKSDLKGHVVELANHEFGWEVVVVANDLIPELRQTIWEEISQAPEKLLDGPGLGFALDLWTKNLPSHTVKLEELIFSQNEGKAQFASLVAGYTPENASMTMIQLKGKFAKLSTDKFAPYFLPIFLETLSPEMIKKVWNELQDPKVFDEALANDVCLDGLCSLVISDVAPIKSRLADIITTKNGAELIIQSEKYLVHKAVLEEIQGKIAKLINDPNAHRVIITLIESMPKDDRASIYDEILESPQIFSTITSTENGSKILQTMLLTNYRDTFGQDLPSIVIKKSVKAMDEKDFVKRMLTRSKDLGDGQDLNRVYREVYQNHPVYSTLHYYVRNFDKIPIFKPEDNPKELREADEDLELEKEGEQELDLDSCGKALNIEIKTIEKNLKEKFGLVI